MAGFTVATGGQGVSFFDNHVSCVQRGVATYVNDAAGRTVEFRGCEVLPGLVLDGAGRLAGAATASRPLDRVLRHGRGVVMPHDLPLERLRSRSPSTRRPWSLWTSSPSRPSLLGNVPRRHSRGSQSWEVTANGQSFTGSDPDLFEAFIDTTGLALSNLPNPSGSLTALTEADLARLALGFGPEFGFDLIQETLAANVGDHTHHMPCGTATVTYDAERLPHVVNEWSSCNFATMILDGPFRAEWGRFDVDSIPAHCAWTFGQLPPGRRGARGRVDDPSVDHRGDPRRFSGKHHGHLLLVGPSDQPDLAGHDPGRY